VQRGGKAGPPLMEEASRQGGKRRNLWDAFRGAEDSRRLTAGKRGEENYVGGAFRKIDEGPVPRQHRRTRLTTGETNQRIENNNNVGG